MEMYTQWQNKLGLQVFPKMPRSSEHHTMHVHLFMLANVTFPLVSVDKLIVCSVRYYGFLTLVTA